jgi:hypothetical protein
MGGIISSDNEASDNDVNPFKINTFIKRSGIYVCEIIMDLYNKKIAYAFAMYIMYKIINDEIYNKTITLSVSQNRLEIKKSYCNDAPSVLDTILSSLVSSSTNDNIKYFPTDAETFVHDQIRPLDKETDERTTRTDEELEKLYNTVYTLKQIPSRGGGSGYKYLYMKYKNKYINLKNNNN